jgi:hypothetical protein
MTSVTPESTVNISRALSKLCRIFITYVATGDAEPNVFKHPTGGNFSIQCRIGSRMIPENPISDDGTAFYQLSKALGAYGDSNRSVNITKANYASHEYVVCLSTEKLLGEDWAGLSIKGGDVINIQHRGAAGVNFQHVMLEYQQVLSLGEIPEVLQ